MRHSIVEKIFIVAVLALILAVGVVHATDYVRVLALTYSVKSSTVTCNNTTALALPTTALKGRSSVAIRLNATTDTVYIGGSDVNSTNGFPLDSSVPAITMDVDASVTVYGISASGTAVIRVLEAK